MPHGGHLVFLHAMFSTSVQGKFVGPLELAFILAGVALAAGFGADRRARSSAMMLKAREPTCRLRMDSKDEGCSSAAVGFVMRISVS